MSDGTIRDYVATNLINRLVDATTELAWVGAKPTEDRKAIRDAYKKARADLNAHIMSLHK